MAKRIYIVLIVSMLPVILLCQEKEIYVDGVKRAYHLTLPQDYSDSAKYPLVVVLHGFNNEIQSIGVYTKFDIKAQKSGFIAVYPHGIMNENAYYLWNAGNIYEEWTNNANDVGFISHLIIDIQNNFSIDSQNIFIAGYSNGSMMAYRIAAELSGKIAAVACVSGQMVDTSCYPEKPVPIMHIHGDSDMAVPHTGTTQFGFQLAALDDVMKKWLQWNNCSTVPSVLKYSPELTALKWEGDAEVRLYLLHGHGHDWPTNERNNWDATDYIWEFFKENSRK